MCAPQCGNQRRRSSNRELRAGAKHPIFAATISNEGPVMAQLPPVTLGRREFLLTTAGAVALALVDASPLGALAQTSSGAQPLKIATIGSGREGGALGTLFAKAGHPVTISSLRPGPMPKPAQSSRQSRSAM